MQGLNSFSAIPHAVSSYKSNKQVKRQNTDIKIRLSISASNYVLPIVIWPRPPFNINSKDTKMFIMFTPV